MRSQRILTARALALVIRSLALAAVGLSLALAGGCSRASDALAPGDRVLLDAHNAYPYEGRWTDRIDRGLATGLPVAIEQDLIWYVEPGSGAGRSVVSHGAPLSGTEPTLDRYFFERIRPLVESALAESRRGDWPLIVLNLDLKSDEPEHHWALWDLLGRYERWLSTAERRSSADEVAPIQAGPVLVLTGVADAQQQIFHDAVPVGGRLRLFGAVHPLPGPLPSTRTNYRRWWNNSWTAIEPGDRLKTGAWTPEKNQTLTAMVNAAHDHGLWIRFYTLNGHDPADASGGWSPSYNFGSLDAVRERWRAAARAGVDFIAADQYELAAAEIAGR